MGQLVTYIDDTYVFTVDTVFCLVYAEVPLPNYVSMLYTESITYIYNNDTYRYRHTCIVYVCVSVCMRLLLLLQLVACLCSTQAFIAQCVVESCASHLHHSLQLMAPHQVVTLEGLEGGKE